MKYRFSTGHIAQAQLRAARLGVLGVAVALTLGACSGAPPVFAAVAGQTEVIALPTLDDTQTLRDSVARTDWAIAIRSLDMAAMATECESCELVLTQTGMAAEIRSEQAGGVWEPWGDFQSSEDASSVVELRPDVGDAPYQVGPLAAFMWVSATQQLLDVATTEGLTSAQRQGMSSILAGRLASAKLLASHYGVDLDAQVDALPEQATQTFAPGISTIEDEGALTGEAPPVEAQSAEESSETKATPYAEEALVDYDCLRSSVLMTSATVLAPLTPLQLGRTLNDRAKLLVSVGTEDHRAVRCTLADLTLEDVLSDMLTTDLKLAGADSLEIRTASVSYTVKDVGTWADLSAESVPTTSLLPLGDENESQS